MQQRPSFMQPTIRLTLTLVSPPRYVATFLCPHLQAQRSSNTYTPIMMIEMGSSPIYYSGRAYHAIQSSGTSLGASRVGEADQHVQDRRQLGGSRSGLPRVPLRRSRYVFSTILWDGIWIMLLGTTRLHYQFLSRAVLFRSLTQPFWFCRSFAVQSTHSHVRKNSTTSELCISFLFQNLSASPDGE